MLGSSYQKELLAQVPAENLPKMFGGKCDCKGGCRFSDQGPWQEKEFTRTPAWAKESPVTNRQEGVGGAGTGETPTAGASAGAGVGASAATATQ